MHGSQIWTKQDKCNEQIILHYVAITILVYLRTIVSVILIEKHVHSFSNLVLRLNVILPLFHKKEPHLQNLQILRMNFLHVYPYINKLPPSVPRKKSTICQFFVPPLFSDSSTKRQYVLMFDNITSLIHTTLLN